MPDIMDCICDSAVGNSFIANVNMLAEQFGTLQQILEVPNDVKAIRDQIKVTENTIESIRQQCLAALEKSEQNAAKTESMMRRTGDIKAETVTIHTKTLDVLDECRNKLQQITVEIDRFEADMVLADGVSNCEAVITSSEDVCPGSVITVKNFRYPVGRNTLLVSCDGIEYYRWVHYDEVGPKGCLSSTIKIKTPIAKGSIIRFYNISSSMAETAYVKAKELKVDIDRIARQIANDVTVVQNAKKVVLDGVEHLNLVRMQIKDYVDRYIGRCNGVVVLADKADIPCSDCLFIVNELAPRINPCCKPKPPCDNPCSNKPLFSEGTICGTIAKKDRYESGCFEMSYNRC